MIVSLQKIATGVRQTEPKEVWPETLPSAGQRQSGPTKYVAAAPAAAAPVCSQRQGRERGNRAFRRHKAICFAGRDGEVAAVPQKGHTARLTEDVWVRSNVDLAHRTCDRQNQTGGGTARPAPPTRPGPSLLPQRHPSPLHHKALTSQGKKVQGRRHLNCLYCMIEKKRLTTKRGKREGERVLEHVYKDFQAANQSVWQRCKAAPFSPVA